jgi:hypothetical protein
MSGITTSDRDRLNLDEIAVVQLCDRHDCWCGTRVAHHFRIKRVEAGPALDVDDVCSVLQHIGCCGPCQAQRCEHVFQRLLHLILEWKMRSVRAVGSNAELARYEHQITKSDRVAVVAAGRSQLVCIVECDVLAHLDHQPRIRGHCATTSPLPRIT